jgi:hypothetical protein
MRRHLAAGQREDRVLAFLICACAIIFVAQWPRLSREAFLKPEIPLEALLGAALVGWVFVMPLVFYGIAALSHLVARIVGGQGTWFTARLALFWTLLVISPLILLQGLVAGFLGSGVELTLINGVVTLAFFAIWGISLSEAERGTQAPQ